MQVDAENHDLGHTVDNLRQEIANLRQQLASEQARSQSAQHIPSSELPDAGSEGLVWLSAEGLIIEADSDAARLLGRPADELMGRSLYELADVCRRADGTLISKSDWSSLGWLDPTQPKDGVWLGLRREHGQIAWLRIRPLPALPKPIAESRPLIVAMRDVPKYRVALSALHDSASRYRSLFESMNEGVLLLAPDGLIVHTNRAFLVMLGLNRQDLMGRPFLEVLKGRVALDGSAHPEQTLLELCSRGPDVPTRIETLGLLRSDGARVWVRISASPQHTATGAFDGTLLILSDVTAQTMSERQSQESESRLRNLFDTIGEAVVLLTPQGRIQNANAACVAMLGLPREDLIGSRLGQLGLTFLWADKRPMEAQEIEALARQATCQPQRSLVVGLQQPDQTIYWGMLNSSVIYDDHQQVESILVAIADISARIEAEQKITDNRDELERTVVRRTEALWRANEQLQRQVQERKKIQEELAQERQFLRQVVDTNPNVIFVQDADGYLRLCNRAMGDLWGLDPADIVGLRPQELADRLHVELGSLSGLFGSPDAQGQLDPSCSRQGHITDASGQQRYYRTLCVPLDDKIHGGLLLCVGVDVTEQRQAQEALAESEAFLRQAIDVVPSSLFVKDNEGRHVLANRELGHVFGVEPEDIVGLDDRQLLTMAGFPLENLTLFEEQDRCLRDTGEPLDIHQERMLMPDGSTRWYEACKVPLTWRGQPGMLLGIVTDITDRIQATQALSQSERVLRQVLDTNPSMIFVKDPEGRYVLVNRTYAEMYGIPADRLLGKTDLDFVEALGIPAEQALAYTTQDDQVRRTKQPLYIDAEPHRSPRGDLHWLMTVKTPLTLDGKEGHILGVAQDITRRRQATEALRQSEELLRAVIDADPNHVYLKDREGRYVLVNQSKADAYHLPSEELVGRTDLEIYDLLGLDPDRLQADLATDDQARVSDEVLLLEEQPFVGVDGQECWFQAIKTALIWRGEPGYVLGVARDVTHRRQLEEQLRQAAKMEAIGRLAGGVAHDFNNLLTVINGYSELLLGHMDADDPVREDLGQILHAGKRAADLTQRLLTFSRQQVLNMQVCDLDHVIDGMARMLRRIIGEDVVLTMDTASATGYVYADTMQIEQMIINLAVNARDAMPGGGTMRVYLGNVTLDASHVSPYLDAEPGEYVMLSVSDTGEGMDESVRAHLFEPFFTTKEVGKGTGLGLAMVYGIVKQMSGSIDVVSTPGRGTTVQIYLPCVEARDGAPAVPPDKGPLPRGTESVLVVEDQQRVSEVVCRFLSRLGYHVLQAASGEQGLQMALPGASLDLILTDVVMPGISGPELVAELRQRGVMAKVVYMSGHAYEFIEQRGDLGHGALFIPKPFTVDQVARVIRRALDQA